MKRKIKVSGTGALVLLTGFFLVIFVSLFLVYSSDARERTLLNSSMEQLDTLLEKQPSDDLKTKIDELQSIPAGLENEVALLTEQLSASTNDIVVTSRLFELASQTDVSIRSIQLRKPLDQEVNGKYYLALPVSLTVFGSVDDLHRFIFTVTHDFATSLIGSVVTSFPEDAGSTISDEGASTTINFEIYSLGEAYE